MYSKTGSNDLYWNEQHLYGSSRVGIWNWDTVVPATAPVVQSDNTPVYDSLIVGKRIYELSNHLGNVLTTISDKKIGITWNGTTVAYYLAEVIAHNDYYPFGMLQPGRSYSVGNGYRYGFNGKEKDNEVKGEGNQYDYGFRIYDPRVGKFLSIDPLATKFPWYTPYQFAGNKPIKAIDLDGAEELELTTASHPNGPDKPGSAKLTIIMDYVVITQGVGAVSNLNRIDPSVIKADFAKGNSSLRMRTLPTPEKEAVFLTPKQNRLANKAEKGSKRAIDKLNKQNITYYNVNIDYDVDVSVQRGVTLEKALTEYQKIYPHRFGIIMDPIPQNVKSYNPSGFFDASVNDLRIHALREFANAVTTGNPAEGYGSIFGLINKEFNLVIFNPRNISLGVNKIVVHEIGHNMTNLGHDPNGNGNYEYNQTGLQSNQPGSIYPTKDNSKTIINDASNRKTLRKPINGGSTE